MLITTHAAVGVLISERTGIPWIAFTLGFLSHFLLDFIPHGDEEVLTKEDRKKGRYTKAIIISTIDVAVLIGLLFLLYATVELPRLGLVLAGVIGAILPDVLDNFLPVFHKAFRWFFLVKFLNWAQNKIHLSKLIQGQRYLHHFFHRTIENFFDLRIRPLYGFTLQAILVLLFLVTIFRTSISY